MGEVESHICYNFYYTIKKLVELQSKKQFLGTFLGVFSLHPLMSYELRPNFWSNGAMEHP